MINFGEKNTTLTENDWCPSDKTVSAFQKSKLLAEKTAWDFIEDKRKSNQICFELSVINPQYIYGILFLKIHEKLFLKG